MKLGIVLAALSLAATWNTGVAQAGRISGLVVVAPALSARKPRLRLYSEWGSSPAPRRSVLDSNGLGQVVIYVDSGPTGLVTGPDSARPAVALRQRDETFVPHLVTVVKGSTVAFPNDDPLFHNVFSLSSARSFDLGRYPEGESKSVRFDRAGVVQVFCHIHSDMSAIVLVLDNPFFARPDAAGRYVIDNLPPGAYRLVGWHERTKPIVRRVRVTPGETAALDFEIPRPTPPVAP
jgi:plastocyanin